MDKLKFSYKRFSVTVMVGAILAATTATAAFSYAWFTNHNNVTNNDIQGSTAGAYFARGDGSSEKPYVINKPIHLYNLAWLQYIGAFDAKEPYFIIEADLDMKDWTLPPIGTTEHPFKGHLDGYDEAHSQNQTSTAKISNLTISNSFGDFSRHPSSVTSFTSPEITGLFGVIEKPNTTSPSVQNLYIDNLTVASKTPNALTGLVAGYVDGQLEGIGINNSKLDIPDGTSKLAGYDNISKYTSVGYCTSEYETSYVKTNTTMYTPAQVGTASFNPTGGGGGQEDDWGGSIDMMSLNRRINYIGAVSHHTLPDSHAYNNIITSDTYNLSVYTSGTSFEFKWDETSRSCNLIYINDGTLLPLNIDETIAFEGNEIAVEPENNKLSKWHTSQFYKNHVSEQSIIKKNNTGYLVGNGSKGGNNNIRSRKQSLQSGLGNSFGPGGAPSVYDPNSIVISSINTKTGQEVADASKSDFAKFNSVKNQFDIMMENASVIHGFHFMQSIDASSPAVKSANNVVIDGLSENNYYEFVKSGLNFTVKNPGYITAILGSYFYTNANQSLFDLFEVKRNGGVISSVKQIEKIYHVGSDIKYSYYGESTNYSGGDVAFDFAKVTGENVPLSPQKAYYFEFPVSPGDYVIGKANTSDSKMAFLMYLDIGANAGGTSGDKVDRTKIYEVFEQVNEEFKYPNGVEIVNFANAGVDSKKFAVVVGASYTGEVKLNYAGGNKATVIVTESNDTGLGYYDAGLSFTSGQTEQVGATTTHTRTQRLTYFDYYRESELGTDALYTNVLQFSQTQTMTNETWGAWGDITRSDYRSGEGNTNFAKYNGVLTIFGDDGKATTTPTITTPLPEESFWDSTVFTLQTKDPTVQSINADWIQTGSFPTGSETSPYVFKVSGYKFTMKDNAGTVLADSQYLATINENYTVSINA